MNDRPRAPFQVMRQPDQTINHLVNRPAFSNFRTRLRHYLSMRLTYLREQHAHFNAIGATEQSMDMLSGRIEEVRYLMTEFEFQPNLIFTPLEDESNV